MKHLIIAILILASCQQDNIAPQSITTSRTDTIRFIGIHKTCNGETRTNAAMMITTNDSQSYLYFGHSNKNFKLELRKKEDKNYLYSFTEINIPAKNLLVYVYSDRSCKWYFSNCESFDGKEVKIW